MRVLIVKKKDSCWPFVEEQVKALQSQSLMCDETKTGVNADNELIECTWHLIEGKGVIAYLRDVAKLIKDIKYTRPDVIHAHYGLSGYYACIVNMLSFGKHRPTVVTYHGSDINNAHVRKISQIAIHLADYNIFVSPKLMEKVEQGENCQVIPCGLNMEDWQPMDKKAARKILGLNLDKRYVLFSSDLQTEVKNPELAKQAMNALANEGINAELIELTGYTREQVNMLMHGVDVCLMTSKTEGSPQFIKEAMVCGCPIVTTRVGDTDHVIGNTEGCFFTDFSVENCVEQLRQALNYAEQFDRTKGRDRIMQLGYDNREVAKKIKEIYLRLVYRKK